jgi:hypothetical protein
MRQLKYYIACTVDRFYVFFAHSPSKSRSREPLFDYLVEHRFGHKPIPSLQN